MESVDDLPETKDYRAETERVLSALTRGYDQASGRPKAVMLDDDVTNYVLTLDRQ